MLKSLSIQNYALISNLNIEFQTGLSIITGETGAGKSILLGALSLILGQRADSSVLLNKEKKCIVEAQFDVSNYNIKPVFEKLDVDYENITSLRREINLNGKSRAFINDTPINLNSLQTIGLKLIDIHSQHQNLELSNNQFQLHVVDSVAKQTEKVKHYKSQFSQYIQLQNEYNNLIEEVNKSKSDLDYYQFQYNQLEEAKLIKNEQEELEKDLEILNHAEDIMSALQTTAHTLSGEGPSILNALKEIKTLNEKIKNYFSDAEEIISRLNSSYIELNDLNREIELLNNKIDHDPERLQIINDRLDLIYSLQQKHRVNTITELIDIKNELENKLSKITSFDSQLEKLKIRIDEQKVIVYDLANEISKNRKHVMPVIENKVVGILQQLGMPNAKFLINQKTLPEAGTNGIDEILFLFSANKFAEVQELSKVASGGEISRLMLSLKSLITENSFMPSIIFDEIDSGVSGEIADKMGNIIKQMSSSMQVINITHLPQIASKGESHYLVYKIDADQITSTKIKLLNSEERINEIAKMLSGEELTEAALSNARELLAN
ncbi:DNA repair protein RecN [Bacteroidota bacterium]